MSEREGGRERERERVHEEDPMERSSLVCWSFELEDVEKATLVLPDCGDLGACEEKGEEEEGENIN